jgi:hypothetical protein
MVGVGLSVKTNILALKLKLTLFIVGLFCFSHPQKARVGVGLSVKETITLTPKLTLMLHGGCVFEYDREHPRTQSHTHTDVYGGCGFECEKIRFYI